MTIKKQDKSRIVQIWGDILDEGFTSVPNILLRYRSMLGIKPQHLSLIIDIMSFKWDTDSPFPSYTTLAKRAGVDERSIKRITQDLEELGLLIKEPRFDDTTGAQITTIFDFRPLVKKLTEEKIKIFEKDNNPNNYYNTIEGDKNVMGEGDKNVMGGMTNITRGGVTNMSPKEYSYINNTNINKITYNDAHSKNSDHQNTEKNKKKTDRLFTDIQNKIHRKRLYEIHDNLIGVKPLEEVVEEGTYKALKDIIVSNIIQINNGNVKLDLYAITNRIKQDFPYKNIPSDKKHSRRFYVDVITNMVINEISVNT